MAHVGVGAFHRCHQAEYTDDLLARRFDRWGVVGINIRPPALADTLGPAGRALYAPAPRRTTASRRASSAASSRSSTARHSPAPALDVLASADDRRRHDDRDREGLLPPAGRAASSTSTIPTSSTTSPTPRRRAACPASSRGRWSCACATHGRPLTLISCDNIPANGVILANVVRTLCPNARRGLADWIAANVAFPSTMVDRIAPATTQADLDSVEQRFGYRDARRRRRRAVPPMGDRETASPAACRAGTWSAPASSTTSRRSSISRCACSTAPSRRSPTSACSPATSTPSTPSPTRCSRPSCAACWSRRALPTLPPVPGIEPRRLCRAEPRPPAQHRDPPPQPPDRHRRLAEDRAAPAQPDPRAAARAARASRCCRSPVAAWMAYLIRASDRFGSAGPVDDPQCRPRRRHRRPRSATTRRRWPPASSRSTPSSTPTSPRTPASARPSPSALDGLLSDRADGSRRRRRPAAVEAARNRLGMRGTMKLGLLTAPFPDTPLAEVADWASSRRLRGAGDRLLAEVRRPEPPLCRHQPHRRRRTSPQRRPARSSPRWPRRASSISGARLLPEPAAPGPRPPRDGHRPPEEGHRRRRPHGRAGSSTPSAAAMPRRPSTTTGRRR